MFKFKKMVQPLMLVCFLLIGIQIDGDIIVDPTNVITWGDDN